jgi:ABC-2 type transport system ATP-binding protein
VPTAPVISVRGLRKRYGSFDAVKGIDLHVERGEVLAILGPNGAGKTTTVEILEGYLDRDGGEVEVLGFDPADNPKALRERVGIVLQECGIDRFLTAREVLQQHASFYPSPGDPDELLALVGLTEKAGERVKRMSGGQQRRLDLALGMIGSPELIFLDEPTTGFDPSARRQAWDIVRRLCEGGTTVVLTTHYLDEAQALADRVMVFAGGEVVASGTPTDLAERSGGSMISFELPSTVHADDLPVELAGSARRDAGHANALLIETDTPTAALHTLTGWALERGIELSALSVARPSLEDVYMQLIEDDAAEHGEGLADA